MENPLNTIGIALVSYLLGVVTGYVGGTYLRRVLSLEGSSYKNLVLVLVSLGWFISVIYELINPSFHTSPFIHGIMGVVVGSFFKALKNE